MKKTTHSNDFTQGKLPRKLFFFAVPFMFSNLLQVLYNVVDMSIVGHVVGSEGLAAVSIAARIITMGTLFGIGFANGGQVLLARYLGANDVGKARKTQSAILWLCAGISILVASVRIFAFYFRAASP